MGFISRLRKVTGKAAEEQEARIRERDKMSEEEMDALLEGELGESKALKEAKAKVKALQEKAAKGE
jgi:hypothetical protein